MPSTVHNLQALYHQLRFHQSNLKLSLMPFESEGIQRNAYLAEEAAVSLGEELARIMDMQRECCDPDSKPRRCDHED